MRLGPDERLSVRLGGKRAEGAVRDDGDLAFRASASIHPSAVGTLYTTSLQLVAVAPR